MSQRLRNICSFQCDGSLLSHPHLLKLLYTSANAAGRTCCDNTAEPIYVLNALAAAQNNLPLCFTVCTLFPAHYTYPRHSAAPDWPQFWHALCLAEMPAALLQVGIPVLGVVENMSGLSQQLDKFKFFRPGPDGSQQDVTDQVMQHLPAELQVMPFLMCKLSGITLPASVLLAVSTCVVRKLLSADYD